MPWTQSIWHTRSGASSSRADVDELIPGTELRRAVPICFFSRLSPPPPRLVLPRERSKEGPGPRASCWAQQFCRKLSRRFRTRA